MGTVISVVNQKGGVGKTTTAVNLAAYLGKRSQKTLLIDADPQGNATSGLGFAKKDQEKTTYDVMINELPLMEAVQSTEYRNLSLCPANIELTGAEIELISVPEREKVLAKAVSPIRNQFDYILIDCPPSLGLMTINALTASDSILIPIQAEYYALEGLEQLIGTYSLVKNSSNPELEVLGIVITMFDTRTQLAHQVEAEVREHFPEQVFKTVIPRNVRLSEAPSYGKPILAYDKWSRGARAYDSLAKEIIRQK
ncbi:MAG: ParA family protein [Clostridiaceae bacterium]|jgi:chromosome partitioning protein|nr:ParA family protein [Clostridiaceae bacterium]